jgi:hypothetical protein
MIGRLSERLESSEGDAHDVTHEARPAGRSKARTWVASNSAVRSLSLLCFFSGSTGVWRVLFDTGRLVTWCWDDDGSTRINCRRHRRPSWLSATHWKVAWRFRSGKASGPCWMSPITIGIRVVRSRPARPALGCPLGASIWSCQTNPPVESSACFLTTGTGGHFRRTEPGKLRVAVSPSNFAQRSKPSLTWNTTNSGPDTTGVPYKDPRSYVSR